MRRCSAQRLLPREMSLPPTPREEPRRSPCAPASGEELFSPGEEAPEFLHPSSSFLEEEAAILFRSSFHSSLFLIL